MTEFLVEKMKILANQTAVHVKKQLIKKRMQLLEI